MMLNSSPIRVLCVDDHAFLVDGLRSHFATCRDIEVVGSLRSADDLIGECQRLRPRVVLLDISMPGKDPFEAVEDLGRICPDVKVIMLSAYMRDHYIDSAVTAGAWGYLSKMDDPVAITEAIRKVARGEFTFGPNILERCQVPHRGRVSETNKPVSKLQTLTAREQQILRMIGKGLTRAAIAKELCRSPKTIDAHRASIMEKMDLHDRAALALYAVREGLVEAG